MNDNEPRPVLEAMARPAGSGFQALDALLVAEMLAMLRAGRAATRSEAARKLAQAGRARGNSESAIVRRLVARFAATYPELLSVSRTSTTGGESDSIRRMRTHPAPYHPDTAALQARLIELQEERAELLEVVKNQQAILVRQQDLLATQQVKIGEAERRQDDLEAAMGAIEAADTDAGIGVTKH